jgi:ppGpp synthetase/RelA/SpoT-type nucleotidyltranferase
MVDVFHTINGKDEKSFLQSYNHDIKSVAEIGIDWPSLVEIHDYYKGVIVNKLEIAAQEMFFQLKTIKGAHTVKYRIKDPEHLIDKIIRKKIDDNREVTKENFLEEFDDFIGFRILHLFKTDWEPIYETIKSKYESKETPVAYHRDGDDPAFIQKCKDLGLEPKVKKAGYRSIHFIAKFPFFAGGNFKCEIQIRTLFEEAWSEIDHLVRYPNNTDNELLNSYLLMFNKLAGYADDMGTFLMAMKGSLSQQQSERNELETAIDELKKEISSLKVKNGKQKVRIDDLMKKLDRGVTSGWPDLSELQYPSTLDYISQIQAPSGSTVMDSIAKFQENLAGYGLYTKSSLDSLQNTLDAIKKTSKISSILSQQTTLPKSVIDRMNEASNKKDEE